MFKKFHVLASIFIALALTAISACAAPEVQPVAEAKILRVGNIMPFTGSAALWGQNIRPGMEIYQDLINEDGGLKIGDDNYKVEMTFLDAYGPAPAAAAARKLIYDNKVSAIVGYFGLGIAAITQVTNPEKVILNIGTIGGRDPSTPDKSYTFYGFPQQEIVINQAIATMQAFPQYHTLAWTGMRSGDQTPEAFFKPTDDKLLKEFGIKSVRVYYPEGTMNFTAYLTKMAEQGAEVIYCVGSPLEVGLLAKQRYQMGYNWPIGQEASNVDLEIVKGLCGSEEAMQNIVSDWPLPWEFKKTTVSAKYLDMAKRMWERFKEENDGKEPFTGIYGGGGALPMCQYFEAVQQAGTTDPDEVMRTIRGGTFDSFFGKYTLSGEQYYGSKVVFGHPVCMGVIKGMETVYLGEYPLTNVDKPFAEPE
ncbi:MAG: ABC transporter substrate-binding protein [Dehalococcoidia bacterium]|nr:ABC transporter substrate-binding protein [Dehalococcoidia bacterium]